MKFGSLDKKNFSRVIESLKKYRRADLVDIKGRKLIKDLYVDLLPDDYILNKCMEENTTFLIGRKGTGKSTIFLRLEEELQAKNENTLSCYIDVKTVYESIPNNIPSKELKLLLDEDDAIRNYLIERSFIQEIIKSLIDGITKRSSTFEIFTRKKKIRDEVTKELVKLKSRIDSSSSLEVLEIPLLQQIDYKSSDKKEVGGESEKSLGVKADISQSAPSFNIQASVTDKKIVSDNSGLEQEFSKVFLQLFNIKSLIEDLQIILKKMSIHKVYVLLDDFSEIDDHAIKVFVDTLLAPLNNWSNEFFKFKVAAYPGREYYGSIDTTKIDKVKLDFYNLYANHNRNKMEEAAISFTRKLLEKRMSFYVKKDIDIFLDLSKDSLDSYYELFFYVSMNVPRALGYILSYCFESRIIHNKLISKGDIELAAKRYYEDHIEVFFENIIHTLMASGDKVNIMQYKPLLSKFIERMSDIKRRIKNGEISGAVFLKNSPYASHFYLSQDYDNFLKTLELNFFISKYTEMSDKDGSLSSIYCLNYGLTQKHNLDWGKPSGAAHAKYFTQRQFSFTDILEEFIETSEKIYCSNEKCNRTYAQDEKIFLEYARFLCRDCGSSVVITPLISQSLQESLSKVKECNLLHKTEMDIVRVLLQNDGEALLAKEIAEELDISSISVGKRCATLDEKKGIVERIKQGANNKPYQYLITEKGKKLYL